MSKVIGIIGAMDIEVDGVVSEMKNTTCEVVGTMKFVCGELLGKKVVVCKCGIGKVFAAICAQTMILKYAPDIIINSGVAGALSELLSVLDTVVAIDVVQHDMDTSPLGDPVGLISGINVVNIETDEKASNLIDGISRSFGVNTFRGTIASGDQFIVSADRKKEIFNKFGAVACEMEGASIGQVCYVNNVPFAIIRSISDGKGEALDYFTFSELAAKQSIKILKKFIEKYEV